jgi:hypothetical protein
MEVEENLGSTPMYLATPTRKEHNFESQLREIDLELEYHPKLKDHNSDFLEHEPDVIIFPTQSNTSEP